MKNSKNVSKLTPFAKNALTTKEMKHLQGGWSFWDWLLGGGGGGGAGRN